MRPAALILDGEDRRTAISATLNPGMRFVLFFIFLIFFSHTSTHGLQLHHSTPYGC